MSKIKLLFTFFILIAILGVTLLPLKSETFEEDDTLSFELPNDSLTSMLNSANVIIKDLGKMKASWYGPRFHGRLTANGEIYDQMGYTVAHKSLPFGTLLRLTNPKNNKSLVVRINDRGPYIPGRQIDLSKKVAIELGTLSKGVVKLRVEQIRITGLNNPLLN